MYGNALIVLFMSFNAIDIATCLTPFQLRYKISKAQCAPVTGHEENVIPCYQLHNKKIVRVEDCGKKTNSHCCIFNCTCIMKGAGTTQGIIPDEYKLPKATLQFNVSETLKDCVPDSFSKPTSTTKPDNENQGQQKPKSVSLKRKPKSSKPKPRSKSKVSTPKEPKSVNKNQATQQPKVGSAENKLGKGRPKQLPKTNTTAKKLIRPKPGNVERSGEPGTKRTKPSTKKPTSRRNPATSRPVAKIIAKPARKPATKNPTTSRKAPATKKTCRPTAPKPGSGRDILLHIADIIRGFGFDATVERTRAC